MRLLFVEENAALLSQTAKLLKKNGYGIDVCSNGRAAESLIFSGNYDCIVLDAALFDISGLTLLKALRSRQDSTPVLMISADASVEERVMGLDCGADDYLSIPFAPIELLARLRTLLRRQSSVFSSELTLGDLTMTLTTRSVTRGGRQISLTAKEFAILEFLLRNKNRLVTRQQLYLHIWGSTAKNDSNIVDVYIRYLRRKLDDKAETKLITTVRGGGYIIKEPL